MPPDNTGKVQNGITGTGFQTHGFNLTEYLHLTSAALFLWTQNLLTIGHPQGYIFGPMCFGGKGLIVRVEGGH